MASLVGRLSTASGSKLADAARAVLHEDEWADLRQPPRTKLAPSWLPDAGMLASLDRRRVASQVAIKLEDGYFPRPRAARSKLCSAAPWRLECRAGLQAICEEESCPWV